ncbi:iron-chelator utilization protein [Hyphomicrobium sulfonivorans]|uniref:Iron-chelator utilization protein n=1 Tax=Hyphomicrobium sulfonivorans TaxID=121290 RepID=A0A120CWB0_HYPSL|nr:ChuX/HutX family heme-like substrate-binding protein [Hyphomicrobium sulfonivorans]KWT69105.1 iron-chelator utilization protein [Hyphomicrobium sulfonivorans]
MTEQIQADTKPVRWFWEMSVRKWTDLTPTMRRITLTGNDVAALGAHGLHARILFPETDNPEWPNISADGRPVWATGQRRMAMRAYTLRHIRPEKGEGEVDIDFLLHNGDGVAAAWARDVRVGDLLGVVGPVGRPVEPADWYLFAGEESSLPPMARMLESLPVNARGIALIEVSNELERQPLKAPENMHVRWLFRDHEPSLPPGRSLAKAVVETAIPETGRVACWLGAELTAFQVVRAHWRQIAHLDEARVHAAPYWNASKPTRTEAARAAGDGPIVLFEPIDLNRLMTQWSDTLQRYASATLSDFALRHDVTEAHITNALAVHDAAVRLNNDWEGIVAALPDVGEVTVVTQNEAAVHRKTGVFDRIMWNEERPVVLDPNINLRIRLESWVHGFFVESEAFGKMDAGLHIFDSHGIPVLRVLARSHASGEKLRSLARGFAHPEQSSAIEVCRANPPPPAPADSTIDAVALAADWRSMLDTHDIFALARRYGAQRTQSYRLVPDDLAREVDPRLFFDVLAEASNVGEGVMIFVGSPGNVQIHVGSVANVTSTPSHFNINDDTFQFDVAKAHAASCWLVSKPTIDGEIRSIELFDAAGGQIAWVFGQRRPGSPQQQSWHALLNHVVVNHNSSLALV